MSDQNVIRDVNAPNHLPKCNRKSMLQLLRFCVAEMLGLGIICFVIVFYDPSVGGVPGPVVVGLTFTWVVWLIGPVSGAQVNPVVTLMLVITRRLSILHGVVCMFGQLVGGTIGCFAAKGLLTDAASKVVNLGMTLPNSEIGIDQALSLEIIGTSLLVFSVLAVADEIRPPNWSQGHSIAFCFEFGVTLTLLASLLIYIIGPLIGMLLATFLYECLLTNGLSAARLKAWFTSGNFDRNIDYSDVDAPI